MPSDCDFGPAEHRVTQRLIEMALAEDLGIDELSREPTTRIDSRRLRGDITSCAVLDGAGCGSARIVAREPGVLAGMPIVPLVCAALDPEIRVSTAIWDGTAVSSGSVVASIAGRLASLLAAERTVLNFLGRLSGIASLTRRFADAVAGTRCGVYDTRKTTPGWRILEKYAVRCGGGRNHRIGLHDAVLIKDNHRIAWAQANPTESLAALVCAARQRVPPGMIVEIEVESSAQLADALAGVPDIVLLDNMSLDSLRECVALRNHRAPTVELEASGGVTLESVRAIAESGVDRVSSGALTHSARVMDLAIDFDP